MSLHPCANERNGCPNQARFTWCSKCSPHAAEHEHQHPQPDHDLTSKEQR